MTDNKSTDHILEEIFNSAPKPEDLVFQSGDVHKSMKKLAHPDDPLEREHT